MISLLFIKNLQTEKARLVPASCAHSHAMSTRCAGLPDHPKRDIIYRVTRTATVSVSTGLCVKHRRVASDDWYSLDVALFHFLSCTYLRCASSITTINVCVSSSYSAMNCFALVRKSILLVLERCFIKSLAPIRIQSFFTRGAKS